ncbi:MAG TPA: hypothetical protein VNI01_13275, partial [Elusimicrobiota bacterium]|nr:hypothetical protein [Elusimicrobiota bacterium]
MIRSAALLAVLLPLFPLPARAGNEVAARRLYEEGLDRYRRGEFPDALSSLTRSIGESKGFLLSYSVRAQVRRALGDAAGSAADAKAALGIGSPRNAETFVARGNARFLARQDRAALGDFEDALHKDEEYADAYLGRGRVRDAAGDRAGAMADWQKALKLDPKLDLARYNLAAALN